MSGNVGKLGRNVPVTTPKVKDQPAIAKSETTAKTTPLAFTPKPVVTAFAQQQKSGPYQLEGKSATNAQVKSSGGGLGFETVSSQASAVKRNAGAQASVGLDCTDLYLPGERLPVLEGLSPKLHKLQLEVNAEVESDPQKYVDRYRAMVEAQGGVPTFVTDDAKGALRPEQWLGADGLTGDVKEFRSNGANAAMHQAAHAVAQMAFVQQLDELAKLPPGDPKRNVLVTNGGCGAGKGYALKQGLSADFKNQFGAIWDAAGEQAGLDNQWIINEAAKRGVKTTLVYVHADPLQAFDRAVTKRFDEEGRLVNTRSFAESYVDGGNNMRLLIDGYKDLPGDVELVVVDNTGPKPLATTYNKDNIEQAQKNIMTVIPAGYEDLESLHKLLQARVPGHLPEHAKHGLSMLD